MSGGATSSITPFVSIMFRPRATIREIVETNPRRYVVRLAAIAAALAVLQLTWRAVASGRYEPGPNWPLTVDLLVVLGALAGIVLLYVDGWLVRWAGSMLGGFASTEQVRAAIAWSRIPLIVALAFAIVGVLAQSTAADPSRITTISIATGLGSFVFNLWALVVTLKCIGEVHRFSAWRALAAAIIAGITLILIVCVLAVVLLLVVGSAKISVTA